MAKKNVATAETMTKLAAITKFADKVMFLWNCGESLSSADIGRIISREQMGPDPDEDEYPPYIYNRVYGTLKRKGVTSKEINQRQELSLDMRRKPKNQAVTTEEGFLQALTRTGRTRKVTMRVRDMDLHGVLFDDTTRLCGGVKEGIPFVHNLEFIDCNLRGASFKNVDMARMTFTRCDMRDVDFSYEGPTVLPRWGTDLPEEQRINYNQHMTYYGLVSFKRCDLQGANFTNRQASDFRDCWLLGSIWDGAAITSLSVNPEPSNDYRSGISEANLVDGSYIHLEKLMSYPFWNSGMTTRAMLKVGFPTRNLLPEYFVGGGRRIVVHEQGDHDYAFDPFEYKIVTKSEWHQLLTMPEVLDSRPGTAGKGSLDSVAINVAFRKIFGVPITMMDNFSGQVRGLNRTLVKWIARHYDILSEPGNEEHPRPIIGTDPFIKHLEIINPEDLGPAGEKTNPNGVLDRVLTRIDNEVRAREEQHRQYQLERGVHEEQLKAMTFPTPSPKFIPAIPEELPIRQLVNYVEFQVEGDTMRHCIAGYTSTAASGRCFIYHVGNPAPEGGTLDLSPEGKINQFRALRNRAVDPSLREAVRAWLSLPKEK